MAEDFGAEPLSESDVGGESLPEQSFGGESLPEEDFGGESLLEEDFFGGESLPEVADGGTVVLGVDKAVAVFTRSLLFLVCGSRSPASMSSSSASHNILARALCFV